MDHKVEPSSESEQWGAVLTLQHPVDYWSIAEVSLALYDLAAEFGGVYDGWETPIISDSPETS